MVIQLLLFSLLACDEEEAKPYVPPSDLDGDGYSESDGDCDDSDNTVFPVAEDTVGDDLDQNCDGVDGVDGDEDGYASIDSGGNDCDDQNALMIPVDQDGDGQSICDGDCDDLDASLNYLDSDGDGQTSCGGDCDDQNSFIFIGVATKDSISECMKDVDGDGYGDADAIEPVVSGSDCDDTDPSLNADDFDFDGQSSCDGDCDDYEPSIHIGAAELDSTEDCMADFDGDGYGSAVLSVNVVAGTDCDDLDATLQRDDSDGDGYSTCDGDCDDSDAALEIGDSDGDGYSTCDGDCDDSDEFTYPGAAEAESLLSCMTDADGDGYGDPNGPVVGSDCDDSDALLNLDDSDGDGFTTCDGDCDDSLQYVYIGAAYIDAPTECSTDQDGDGYSPIAEGGSDCNDLNIIVNIYQSDAFGDGVDQNCDGVDGEDNDGDGDASVSSGGADCDDLDITMQSLDLDGDGYSTCDGDCDDQNPLLEIGDVDADGYSTCDGDCDDSDEFTYPGAAEAESLLSCMTDADGDGYGDPNGPVVGSDCDDSDALLNNQDFDADGFSSCDGDCDDFSALIVPILDGTEYVCYNPSLTVFPSSISFEEELGCGDSQMITILNDGSYDTIVTDVSIGNSADISLDLYSQYNGSLPWTLTPNQAIPIFVNYSASGAGLNSVTLDIESNSSFDPTISVTVSAQTPLPSSSAHSIEYGTPTMEDYIFVVDTRSDAASVAAMELALDSFVSGLFQIGTDFRVSIIGTEDACIAGAASYIDSSTPPSTITAIIHSMMASNQAVTTENLLDQMVLAVESSDAGECNDGFVRSGAQWHLIGFGTNGDGSTTTAQQALTALETIKGDNDIIMHSFYDPTDGDCGSIPVELAAMTQTLGGQEFDICSLDYAQDLWTLAYSTSPTESLVLREEPWEDSLVVFVDSVPMSSGWNYDASTNQIVFSPVLPGIGSIVDISYEELGECLP